MVLGVTAMSVGTIYNNKMSHVSAMNYKHKLQTYLASDGMMTLLAQEVINGNASRYVGVSRRGTIKGEKWNGVSGVSVQSLMHAMMNPPSEILTSEYLGSQIGSAETRYGIKWSGYLLPPITGSYKFITRSDDNSEFYLSTDTSKANLSTSYICSEKGSSHSWPRLGETVSKPVNLIAGKRYYFVYYHKQNTEEGFGQMGWDGPDGFSERPITGDYLSEYASDPESDSKFGGIKVKYQVMNSGIDSYKIFTEALAVSANSPTEIAYRSPLSQDISMRGNAGALKSAVKVPIVIYDYLADGSNPEFNMNKPMWKGGTLNGWWQLPVPQVQYQDGLFQGMVKNKLTVTDTTRASYFGRTSIPKPSRNDSRPGGYAPNMSCGLDMWFKDWVSVSNVYDYNDAANCSATHLDTNTHRWKNVWHKDSLEFTLDESQGHNTYVFSRLGNHATGNPITDSKGEDDFFPLDNFFPLGKDKPDNGGIPGTHNYAFCSEMHLSFQHQSGLKFNFVGDDDVWVFINDSLVIDLGGVHAPEVGDLNLDDLKNLKYGKTYNMDYFQCERHVAGSTVRIETNLISPPPKGKAVVSWKRDYGQLD